MRIISNTLKTVIERWEDSGDYPSGAGSGPLPSHDFVEEIEGQITVEFTPEEEKEIGEFADEGMSRTDCIAAWLLEDPAVVDHGIGGLRVSCWSVDDPGDDLVRPRPTVLSVEDFEADRPEPPEPDYDPCDEYEREERDRENILLD